ncbi:hypothetical protein MMC29_000454 [Sticta canariensis]|nr:hypothetical protein [Sticta canariensis]
MRSIEVFRKLVFLRRLGNWWCGSMWLVLKIGGWDLDVTVLYIKKLSADEGQAIDNKQLSEFNKIFTKNVTYKAPSPNVVGVDKLVAASTKS